jgi:hypothetical protein
VENKKRKINWTAPLIENNKLSMGRLQHWVLFFMMCHHWAVEKTVPETMMAVFMTLAMYNFGKKGVDAYEHWIESRKRKEIEVEDH